MTIPNDYYNKYIELCNRYIEYEKDKLPLCAAENYLSGFVYNNSKIWEGKYCLSLNNFLPQNDFVGAQFIDELLTLTVELCNRIFKCEYSNPKTLSGMNCFTTTVLSCSSICKNKNALVTSPDSGGHQSIPRILSLLGFNVEYMPYDYENYDIDYDAINQLLKHQSYGLIVFAQSDLLQQPNLDLLNITNDSIVIYDATQTLGLIAAELLANPLQSKHDNLVLIGGTHKTFPGPSCGLIMTNNNYISTLIDEYISPICIRYFHPENTSKLLLSLIEFEQTGRDYQKKILWTSNMLASLLEKEGFKVAHCSKNFTSTHQIFVLTSKEDMGTIYDNAIKYGITLNKKIKPLFSNYGIRLGVQHIARFDWGLEELEAIAKVLKHISEKQRNDNEIKKLLKYLITQKEPHFIIF